jgi:hypothetical protein
VASDRSTASRPPRTTRPVDDEIADSIGVQVAHPGAPHPKAAAAAGSAPRLARSGGAGGTGGDGGGSGGSPVVGEACGEPAQTNRDGVLSAFPWISFQLLQPGFTLMTVNFIENVFAEPGSGIFELVAEIQRSAAMFAVVA